VKTSLILGSAVVLALTVFSITAEARMGAGGAGMSPGMSRMSGGDVRLNTSNVSSPRTFSPDGKVAGPGRVTFSPDGIDGGVSAKPLKVKGHNKYKKSEDPENDPPEKEPKPKPPTNGNGGGTTTGSGGNPSGGYYDQRPHPHYGGYYGPGPHHAPSYCYYKPC